MNKQLKTMLIVCFSICFSVNNLSAQEIWENMVEQLVIRDEENSFQWENLMEDLTDLKEHPIPINTATKEQLDRIPFLSDHLVENILYYIYKYGPMLSDKKGNLLNCSLVAMLIGIGCSFKSVNSSIIFSHEEESLSS